MKFALVAVLSVGLASAYPSYMNLPRDHPPVGVFQKPGPGDARSPCPAFNSLANHGHIPRDGRKVTFNHIVRGFVDILGLSEGVSKALAAGALCLGNETTNAPDAPVSITPPHDASSPQERPDFILSHIGQFKTPFGVRDKNDFDAVGNPTLNLDELSKHNKIEHDASLVRLDADIGDNTHVNPDLLQRFLAKSSDGKFLTVEEVGQWRGERFHESKSANPNFRFGEREGKLAFGEGAALSCLFGNPDMDNALPLNVVEIFLGQDRLPSKEEGWTKRAKGKEAGVRDLIPVMLKIKNSAGDLS